MENINNIAIEAGTVESVKDDDKLQRQSGNEMKIGNQTTNILLHGTKQFKPQKTFSGIQFEQTIRQLQLQMGKMCTNVVEHIMVFVYHFLTHSAIPTPTNAGLRFWIQTRVAQIQFVNAIALENRNEFVLPICRRWIFVIRSEWNLSTIHVAACRMRAQTKLTSKFKSPSRIR